MVTMKTAQLAGAIALTMLTAMAMAHHSGSMFDETKPLTLRGTVKSFAWVNPHGRILLVVDSPNAGAETIWVVETTSTGRLTREGWTKRSLKPGDRIEAKIGPAHNGNLIGTLMEIKNLDTGEVLGHTKPTAYQ